MTFQFTHPQWLLLLPVAWAWVAWLAWRTDVQIVAWRRWMAVTLRFVVTLLIVLAFFMTFLAVPARTYLPVFAKDIFQRGPETYALFLSLSGAGSVVGALTVAALGNVKNKGRVALTMLILLGAGMSGFAFSTSMVASCVLLFVFGGAISQGGGWKGYLPFLLPGLLVQTVVFSTMGTGVGLNDASDDHFIGTGLSIRFH